MIEYKSYLQTFLESKIINIINPKIEKKNEIALGQMIMHV